MASTHGDESFRRCQFTNVLFNAKSILNTQKQMKGVDPLVLGCEDYNDYINGIQNN